MSHLPYYLKLFNLFSPLKTFPSSHTSPSLPFSSPFHHPSSSSTVRVIIKKAAVNDKQYSERRKSSSSPLPYPAHFLPVLWANDDSGAGVWGVGQAVSHPDPRSVVGGAYIPRWRPVVGQFHLCLLVTPPTGPLQGLMGTTICWTCSCLFVVQLSSR